MLLGNVIFPLWAILFFHPILLIIVAIANLLIDSMIALIYVKVKKIEWDREKFIKFVFYIWPAGFLADFAGFLFLMIISWGIHPNIIDFYLIYTSLPSVILFLFAVFFSGVVIYFLDRKIALKFGMEEMDVRRFALIMAVFTAPYFMLIPTPGIG